jgi:hypothetical protein
LVVGKLKVSTFNKVRHSIGGHTILGRGEGGDLGTYAHHPSIGPFGDSTNGSLGMMSPMSHRVTNGPNEKVKKFNNNM